MNKRLFISVVVLLAFCQGVAYFPHSFTMQLKLFHLSGFLGGVPASTEYGFLRTIADVASIVLFLSEFIGIGVYMHLVSRQQAVTLKQGFWWGAFAGGLARLLSTSAFVALDVYQLSEDIDIVAVLDEGDVGGMILVTSMLYRFVGGVVSGVAKGGGMGYIVARVYGKRA